MGDAASVGHAVKQSQPALILLQHELSKAQEDVMDIMRRGGGGDTVDEGLGHGRSVVGTQTA